MQLSFHERCYVVWIHELIFIITAINRLVRIDHFAYILCYIIFSFLSLIRIVFILFLISIGSRHCVRSGLLLIGFHSVHFVQNLHRFTFSLYCLSSVFFHEAHLLRTQGRVVA